MQKYIHLVQIVETEKVAANQLRTQLEDQDTEIERLKAEVPHPEKFVAPLLLLAVLCCPVSPCFCRPSKFVCCLYSIFYELILTYKMDFLLLLLPKL